MYANDLALVASFPEELKLYCRESARTRDRARPNRHWLLAGQHILKTDEHHCLGVLRSVQHSTLSHTSERCMAGWSGSFKFNAVGCRFGCLHRITSHRLITLSLPIMLYGSEQWKLTKMELLMLERAHGKGP